MAKPSKNGGDRPPGSLTPEEVKFQRDLQTAIQLSLQEDSGISNQPATSELQLTGSSAEDGREENSANGNIVHADDNKPNVEEETEAVERKDGKEAESSSEDSAQDHEPPKEKEIDSPPCSLTPEQVQFQKDLQALIQRSFEVACGVGMQLVASTSGLTGSSSEDKSEENTADNNNLDAVDNQPNIQEKSQAPERENNQEEESSSGDTDEYVDSYTKYGDDSGPNKHKKLISLSDTSSEDEVEELSVDDQPNDKGEAQSLKQEDVQEKEFNSEDSSKEDDSKKVNGIDSPPASPVPEEVQFLKDLQTAIQLSMEDACGIRKQPAPVATTSETKKSGNQSPPDSEDSSDTLTAPSSEEEYEENKANNNTVNAVDNQPDILKESQPTKQEYDQKVECSSRDSGKEHDSPKEKKIDTAPYSPTSEYEQFEKDLMTAIQRSLEETYGPAKPACATSESTKTENKYPPVTGDGSKRLQFTCSCYVIESEETTANDTRVIALDSRPDILKESQPLEREDAQEESCPGYSGKEHNSPKKKEIYTSLCILTPEEIQFQTDLDTAIQLSMEDVYGFGRQPVVATSELTGSSKAESEKNTADDNTVHAVDNRHNIKEESQALRGENYQQQESSARDSGIKNDSIDYSRVTGLSLTVIPPSHIFGRGTTSTRMSSEPKDLIVTSVYENSAMIHQKKNSPTGDVASGTEKSAPLGRKPDRPREIDPDAPRCPVGEGAVKKMFRRPAESPATTSSSSLQPGLEEVDRVLQAPWGQSALGVWQYPHPKRLPYTEQLIVKDETPNVSKNETVSETMTTDDSSELKFQQELKEQEQPAFANILRKRWSKPHTICTDNVAYLQKQKTMCEESEEDKPHTQDIFQAIKRWELKEYLEANRRNRMANFQQPAATRENIQPIMNNDNQQPPAIKEINVWGTGKNNPPPPPPATRASNKLIMKNDNQQPPAIKEINVWDTGKNNPPPPPATRDSNKLIMKNDNQQPPAIKEINVWGIGKKNPPPPPPATRDSNKLMVWNIPPITVQQKKTMINTEPKKTTVNTEQTKTTINTEQKKTTINTEQKETMISPEQPNKITGNENYKKDAQDPQSSTRPVIMSVVLKKEQQTVSDNMKETSPVEEKKKCTEPLLHDIVRVFFEKEWPGSVDRPDSNIQKYVEPQIQKETRIPFYKKDRNISHSKVSNIPLKVTDVQIKSVGMQTVPEDEFKICEITTKLLEDIKELDLNNSSKCNTQMGLDNMNQGQPDDISKHKDQQISDAKMVGDEQPQFTPSTSSTGTHSAEFDNEFNKKLQICVDEKEMSEKYSSDRCKKIRCIRRRAKGMDRRNLPVTSTLYNVKSDATAMQENQDGWADKEEGGSVDNVPTNGADTEEESYKDELRDSFDMIKQDIIIIHKNIQRRAQIYGYPRCRRHRMASAQRSKKMPKSANKQRPDDKKDATQPKTDGCADKEECGSVDNVPPNGADTEEESYKDELRDSFDMIKQDISIIHKIIQRRAQKYGYARCRRRRRMASAQRSKKTPKSPNLQCPDDKKDVTQPKTGSLRKVPSISWKGQLQNNSLYDQIRKQWLSNSTEGGTQTDKSCCLELQKFTRGFPGRFVRWCSCHANRSQCPPPPQVQGPPAQMQPGDEDKEKVPNQQPVVPVINGIANGNKSHSEPLQELDNDVKDESYFEQKFDITQEQSTVMQADIRNYLRTFGIPVQRVTSVSFVRDASFVADKDTAKGEHVLAEQRSNNNDSSKQNKKSSSRDDDSDEETDKAPRDAVDH